MMLARLGDYWRVYRAFWRTCVLVELEYRGHFIMLSLTSLLWTGAWLLLIDLIFRNIRSIGGWTLDQMWLLTGAFLLTNGLAGVFIGRNMSEFSRLVNRGELDFVLARPLNSQFAVSTRYVDLKQAPATLLALAVVGIAIQRLDLALSLGAAALFAALVLIGLLIVYALWFMSVTLIIFSGRIGNIASLMHAVLDVARVPSEIYGPVVNSLLTLVLPLAFVATVPASALLGQLDGRLIVYGAVVAALLLLASHLFWQFALRRYASASS